MATFIYSLIKQQATNIQCLAPKPIPSLQVSRVYEIVVDGTAILKHQSWTHLTALRQFAGSRMVVWMGADCPHPHHHPYPSEPPEGGEVRSYLQLFHTPI